MTFITMQCNKMQTTDYLVKYNKINMNDSWIILLYNLLLIILKISKHLCVINVKNIYNQNNPTQKLKYNKLLNLF